MTLAPHQRSLQLYVTRFLAHYARLLPCGAPAPAPPEVYCAFCDRLLWLYHRYVAETAHQPAAWRKDAIIGQGNSLWPVAEREQRIFYMILTRVLTAGEFARTPVTDAKVFVWLADPFLLACERAGLFAALPPFATLLVAPNETAATTPLLAKLREDLVGAVARLLTGAEFAPQTLHDFLHPTVGTRWLLLCGV